MAFDYKKMLKREFNVGLKDRRFRFIGGSAALLLSVFMGNIPLLLIGGGLLATGFMRWCPVYSGLSKTTVGPNEPADHGCCSHSHSH
ncbi:MAG: DUF2892 domain-containing protein [Methylococcus sp.]|nr:DUF2892 domain-containing protein [Methylococcus sp.]